MIATKANMRKAMAGIINPSIHLRVMDNSDGTTFSANPGDYWNMSDDAPLMGADDEPCVLVAQFMITVDVDEIVNVKFAKGNIVSFTREVTAPSTAELSELIDGDPWASREDN